MNASMHKKREANFSTIFRHWIRAYPPKESCHFEIKQTQKDALPFSAVEPNQLMFGKAIMDSPKGVLIRNQGMNGEPDYSYTYRDPVYIVIKYPYCFTVIPLAKFILEKAQSKRKSLTSERAIQIATWHEVFGGKK